MLQNIFCLSMERFSMVFSVGIPQPRVLICGVAEVWFFQYGKIFYTMFCSVGIVEVFFCWAVSVLQPGRKSTGKKNPCNHLAKHFGASRGTICWECLSIFYGISAVQTRTDRWVSLYFLLHMNSTENIFYGVFSVGLSLYKLVGNLPERKTLVNQSCIILAHRVLWDQLLRERERNAWVTKHIFIYIYIGPIYINVSFATASVSL